LNIPYAMFRHCTDRTAVLTLKTCFICCVESERIVFLYALLL